MIASAWLCLLSPLGTAALITLAGTRITRRVAGYLATLSVLVSFVGALIAFFLLATSAWGCRSWSTRSRSS